MKIGFFDSGIGGLTVLKKVINNFGNHKYYYLGDSLNVPYGSKPIPFLLSNVEKIFLFFDSLNVDILISACNTTDSIIKKNNFNLDNFNFKYVSLIENAVKNVHKNDSVLLLATENTVKLGVYRELLKAKGVTKYEEKACPLFVPLIEEGYWYGQMADSILRFYLRDYKSKYKKVILGCTHYPILEKQIKKYTNSLILDPADGIVNFLEEEVQLSKNSGDIKVNYYITGNVEKFESLSKAFMFDVSYKPFFSKLNLTKIKSREKNLVDIRQ